MRKNSLFIPAGAVIIFIILLMFACRPAHFNWDDLAAILSAAILIGAAFFVKNRGHQFASKYIPEGFLWKAFILLASMAFINRGFDVYSMGAIGKSMVFLLPGIAGIFAGFAALDGAATDTSFSPPEFEKETAGPVTLRAAACFVTACIGVFFYNFHHDIIGTIFYAAALFQLFYIFRFKPAGTAFPEEPADGEELTAGKKTISLAMITAAFFFYYLCLKYLKLNSVHISLVYFLLGSFLFGMAPRQKRAPVSISAKNAGMFDLVFTVFIFIAGLFIFSRDLSGIPPGIHGDETLFLDFAKTINSGTKYPFFIDNPQIIFPSFTFWLLAVVCKIFGQNITVARWASIVVSSALLSAVYLMMKDIFNRRAAVLSSLFLSCFFLVLLYSRHAINWMHVPAVAVVGYYMLYRGLKKGNPVYFILSGLLLGFDLYFYSASRLAPLFFVFFTAFLFVKKDTRALMVSNWKSMALLFFSAILIQLPVIYYSAFHAHEYFGRVKAVSLFKTFPPMMNDYYFFFENILKQSQMFFTRSANGYAHNLPQKPFFDPLTGFWALAGLGYLFFTWKRAKSGFLNIWLFTGMLASYLSGLGPEDPFPSRVVLALPAIIITIAIGIERAWSKIEDLWPRIFRYIMPLCAIYIFSWYAYYNLHNFFVLYKNDPHTQVYYRSSDKLLADYVIKNRDRRVIFSPFFNSNYYFGRIDILSGKRWDDYIQGGDISLFELSGLYDEKDRDATIIGEGIYSRFMEAYRTYFPDAKLRIVWDYNFWQFDPASNIKYCYEWLDPDKVLVLNKLYSWYYVYDPKAPLVKMVFLEIPHKDLEAAFSLNAEYMAAGRTLFTNSIRGTRVTFPKQCDRIVVTGLIDVPEYGKYEFKVSGAGANIYINNSQAGPSIQLSKGLNRIKVVLSRDTSTDTAVIKWKEPSKTELAEIPRKYLINSDKIYGLTATYSQGAQTIYKELEPAIDYREYWYRPRPPFRQVQENCFNITWKGNIDIKAPGTYDFQLESKYNCRVMIDGKTVFNRVDGIEHQKPDFLTPGKKTIQVESYFASNDDSYRLMYKPEAQKLFTPVTYDMLTPGL